MKILSSIVFLWTATTFSSGQQGNNGAIQFHGSGSSVMSQCAWHIMETLASRTKIPVRATYRSIGSGSGQRELMGNTSHPYSDFAASDNPLTPERYAELQANGKEVVHLPVIMGAMALFHSVEEEESEQDSSTSFVNGGHNLNLTSCLIARIYKGEIDDWKHPDILQINPGLKLPIQYDFYGQPKNDQSVPIQVAYRARSSGSTFTFTTYLHKACPEHWEAELVGNSIAWPMEGDSRALPLEGTSGMAAGIRDGTNVIGYIDAGFGIDSNLQEVALRMDQSTLKEDFYLTSQNSLSKDGLAAALQAEGTNIPVRGDADWSGVDTINQIADYVYAWPMVAITYVIIRKDLPSFISNPESQSLLVAFLKALYDPSFIRKCEEDYLFLPVPESLANQAMESIDMISMSPDAPTWILEDSVLDGDLGTGDYTISRRRNLASNLNLDVLQQNVEEATDTLTLLATDLETLKIQSAKLETDLVQAAIQGANGDTMDVIEDLEKRADTSFIIALVSLSLCVLSMLVIFKQNIALRQLQLDMEAHAEEQAIPLRK